MQQSNEFAPKITSGVDIIDRTWGGLFKGGSYLVYGRVSNGRGLLALAFEQAGVALGERSMYVSNAREKDLLIQSTAIGFNVPVARTAQLFKHVRTRDLAPNNPESASERIRHLTEIILDFNPARLVINDLVSLVSVGKELTLGEFRDQFIKLLEQIEAIDTTAIFTLPDPGNGSARKLAEFIMSRCTGAIHVGARDSESDGYKLTLLPQIGHVTRRGTVSWPLHDVVSQFENVEKSYRKLVEQRAASNQQVVAPAQNDVERLPAQVSNVAPTAPVESVGVGHTELATTETTDVVEATTIEDLADGLGIEDSYPTDLTLEEAQSRTSARGDDVRVARTRNFKDRSVFAATLDRSFANHQEIGENFLLVAMRVDPSREPIRPFDFEFLSTVVLETLREQDEAFVDLKNERLVLLFPKSNADDSQDFFARVRARLRRDAPQQATHLLNLVSAIVVPNGNPFSNAERFMSYVLDSN